MQQFNLSVWLQDKSRKICTRDGRPVRIVCWDVKQGTQDDDYVPILALIDKGEEIGESSYYYTEDGKFLRNIDEEHNCDLFFVDEEELTEFDYAVLSLISDHNSHTDSIEAFAKRSSKKLLDLARKELEENYYAKVLDDRVVFKSKLHDTDLQTAYDMGKQDALKDLPKWKKVPKTWKVEDNAKVVFSEDYKFYINKKELFNKLPKE